MPRNEPGDGTSASSAYSDRTCLPEDTLRRIGPLLPTYGITRLSRLTTLDKLGIPVWNAVAPNAKSIVINQGKGITDIDAKVSAAMEALERAVAGRPEISSLKASLGDLLSAGRSAEPLACLVGHGQNDLDPQEQIDWVPAMDLVSRRAIFVPLDAVLLDQTAVGPRFWQSSDGLASGNTLDEANLHAVLERIERDAYVLWQVMPSGSRAETCVEPLSIGDPVVTDLAGRASKAGLILRLFDVTSDIDVACYSALLAPADILAQKQPRYLDVTHGSGAHPDPRRAAIRAITEAAQARLTYISGARDDVHPETFDRPLPDDTRRLLSAMPRKATAFDGPMVYGAPALLAYVLDQLVATGVAPVLSVALTDVATSFSVVKVLIPQLENPEGSRKRQFGERAISKALSGSV